jgi:hypothetical protein
MTTQQDCSLGIKKESEYGTYVAPDQFLEHRSESFDVNITHTQGVGARVGSTVARAGRRRRTKFEPGGSFDLEVPSAGFGIVLAAVFGTVTNNEVPTDTDVWQQVHTPKTTDYLDSYTIQKGVPPLGGGATHAMSFLGAQCASLELKASSGDLLIATAEWIAKDMVTSEAYAAPSYPTALDLFTFADAGIYVGNTITKATATALAAASGDPLASVREFSLKFSNGLDSNGFNMGGAGKRTRKAAIGVREISGSLTVEYENSDLLDAWIAQEDLTLLLNFQIAEVEIAEGISPTLQIHIPLIRLDGKLPAFNGGDVITTQIPFVGMDSLAVSTAPIYVVYRTTDTQP